MGKLFARVILPLALALAGGSVFAQTNAVSSVEAVWPAALAPAYREFATRCAAGKASRGDLIALKRFIAASAVDAAVKTNLIFQARKKYQQSKKRD